MTTNQGRTNASFGELLRHHRLAAGLTQGELAARARISARGISDLERGARTRPQRETVRLLIDALHLVGSARAAFDAAARHAPRRRSSSASTERDPFPEARLPRPLDALVGREHQMEAVTALLRRGDVRVLTLTGPGGVGKTRLALSAAAVLRGEFPDGVAFVDLSPIREAALVLPTVAAQLGSRDVGVRSAIPRLRDRLASRRLLLLLDNLEHLLAAAPQLVELLGECPRLTLLATSRALLRISGEHAYVVPPLALPTRDPFPLLESLRESEAVRLFVARTTVVDPHFALTSENALAVAEICRRVDGLPLAIELAAARAPVLPPEAMLARLDARLPLLTGGRRDAPVRQRTMWSTIAWSYDLLTPEQQALFRRLGAFVGGWTLEAAEVVAGDVGEPGVLEGMTALTEVHLVGRQPGHGSGVRFGMLETVREFGLAQLAASGEEDAVRRRHAVYFVEQAEAAGPWLEDNRGGPWQQGAGIDGWLDRLTVEWPNVRAAADWAVCRGEAELLLRLGCAVYPFFNTYSLGESSEGRRWLEAGLAVGEGPDVALRVWALGFASTLATVDGDHAHATAQAEEGLALARVHGNRRGEAEALDSLGFSAMFRGDLAEAAAHYTALLDILRDTEVPVSEEQSLSAFSGGRPADDAGWVPHTLDSLAAIALGQGAVAQAAALAEEARAMLPASGCSAHHARLLGTLGAVALAEGDQERAAWHWRESLGQWRSLRNRRGVADGLAGLASVMQTQGEREMADRFLGAAEALLEEVGARHLIHAVALDGLLATTRSMLTAAETLAWNDGRQRPDAALDTALAGVPTTTERSN